MQHAVFKSTENNFPLTINNRRKKGHTSLKKIYKILGNSPQKKKKNKNENNNKYRLDNLDSVTNNNDNNSNKYQQI